MTTPLLDDAQLLTQISAGLATRAWRNQRVLVLIPDGTRTMPMPRFYAVLSHLLRQAGARQQTWMVALGTHPAMDDAALTQLLGVDMAQLPADVRVVNHAWQDAETLVSVGRIDAAEMRQLSGGLSTEAVDVRINRAVLEHDQILICGPVFPHEVVGFSGGNKYLFPGISGPDVINATHWLGALLTSYAIIGTPHTAVRSVIDRAAQLIPTPRFAVCAVVTTAGVHGVFIDSPEQAWAAAAKLSSHIHMRWLDKPVQRVIAVLPTMYDELWVGSKGMYKSEPVVADGGEVVIYAPHLREVSVVHGKIIRQIGYHVRDYFLAQWEKFGHLPKGVIAHSTHLRGVGTYENGIERPRITVTLATGLSQAECAAINLNYADYRTIAPDALAAADDPECLVIPRAGEFLYRLRS
ncbi:MAG: lactate racemase domain-containing protein [Roseiflexaceae bacterium]